MPNIVTVIIDCYHVCIEELNTVLVTSDRVNNCSDKDIHITESGLSFTLIVEEAY